MQAIRHVSAAITKPLTRQNQLILLIDAAMKASKETIFNSARNTRGVQDSPVQGNLGINLVYVLATGARTAGKRKRELGEGDLDISVHDQHRAFSSRFLPPIVKTETDEFQDPVASHNGK